MKYPRQVPDVAWNQIGDRVVILELGDKRLFHELNETGSLIWQGLDGQNTPEKLSQVVASMFDISPDVALADIQDFLKEMEAEGLIEDSTP